MGGVTLLAEARTAGLTVRADGDRLVIRGPRQADPIARRLIAAKADVLAAIAPPNSARTPEYPRLYLPPDPWDTSDWVDELDAWPAEIKEEWDERAAVMEHDGGLGRQEAEAAAFHLIRGRIAGRGMSR